MAEFDFVQEFNAPQPVEVDVPVFDNSRGQFPSGIYGVKKVVYLKKSGNWMLITSHFKMFVKKDESPNTWLMIDSAMAKGDTLVAKVNRLHWQLGNSEGDNVWAGMETEKAEIWEPRLVHENELEADPVHPTFLRRSIPQQRKNSLRDPF